MGSRIFNGSLPDPLQTGVVDVVGNGAVRTQHDAHLAALIQDLPGKFFDFLLGTGVDVRILGITDEYRLSAKELFAVLQADPFHIDGEVDGSGVKVGEEVKIIGSAVVSADMEKVDVAEFVGVV